MIGWILSGAELGRALGYECSTAAAYWETVPKAPAGWVPVKPGEVAPAGHMWWDSANKRWSSEFTSRPFNTSAHGSLVICKIYVERPLPSPVVPHVYRHLMMFGADEYTVEVQAGKLEIGPTMFYGVDGNVQALNTIERSDLTHETSSYEIRRIILDRLGIEDASNMAGIAPDIKPTRTSYGPGTLAEHDVNL